METMKDIRAHFASAKEGEYNALFQHYENDERSGVQKLIQQYRKKLQALENERARTEIMKEYEHKYEHLGYRCGIDEVGRGPLAGPVVACAVILYHCVGHEYIGAYLCAPGNLKLFALDVGNLVEVFSFLDFKQL